jgi:tellurite resistance protein TerC
MLMWILFHLLIVVFFVLDFTVLRKRFLHGNKTLILNLGWIGLAFVFNGWVYWWFGLGKAVEFFLAYIIEKSLSIDNVFIFGLIFSFFRLPNGLYEKVLFNGIFVAVILRLVMILCGVYLIESFQWLSYFLGAFVVFLGIKWIFEKKKTEKLEESRFIRWISTCCRVTNDYVEDRYFIVRGGVHYVTPLFLVLVVVEFSDIIFALDSVPTVLAITQDPFIAYTSNVFAILGLRALYFWVSSWIFANDYWKKWLGGICIILGVKMVLVRFFH